MPLAKTRFARLDNEPVHPRARSQAFRTPAARCGALRCRPSATRAAKSPPTFLAQETPKTTYAGSQRARKPQRPRPHDCGTAARPTVSSARPEPTTRRDAGANSTRNITTPRPTNAPPSSPLRRANMSSKAKAPKDEAPMSPTKKGKSKNAKSPNKGPKSPAKVKSVKKAAETPVKTSSKKKAAETPQTKPKEKRSGPYEARWKKAMYVPITCVISHIIYVGASSRSSSPG